MPTTPTQPPWAVRAGAPSPAPDSERYAARAAAPKAVTRLYNESRVAQKRADQAEREAKALRRTVAASSEIARRRNDPASYWLHRGGDDAAAASSDVRTAPSPSQETESPLPSHVEARLKNLPDEWAGEVRDLIQQSRGAAEAAAPRAAWNFPGMAALAAAMSGVQFVSDDADVDVEVDVQCTPPRAPSSDVWPRSPHTSPGPKLWSPRQPPRSPERECPPGRVPAPPRIRPTRTVELSTVEDEADSRAVVVRQDSAEYGSSLFCGCTSGFGEGAEPHVDPRDAAWAGEDPWGGA